MNVFHAPAELPGAPRRVCAAIGVFDGVHLGHQQVIRQTIADAGHHEAVSVVITFDRHPNAVVAPHAVPPAIYSLPQKLSAIAALGTDATLVIPFDEDFSRRTAESFITQLIHDFGSVRSLCVGREFTFGRRRQGNVALLERMGAAHGFKVHGLASVSLDGQVVSSTRIRQCIQAGNLDAASQMLGREYELSGTVTPGDQLGRQLGFPTANLDIQGLATPPSGVYAVHARLGEQRWRGVANLGSRPTVAGGNGALKLEVHLLDFHEEIYGAPMTVQFLQHLRPELKFDSLEELREQIERDITAAIECF
jgi:riboflavin kinase / FMN adenylyltransferase